jgi:hypothetical protein
VPTHAHAQGDSTEGFFRLLVEVVKVEALVTLRDALAPAARVPLQATGQQPGAAQPEQGSAAVSAAPSSSAPAETMDGDSDDEDGMGECSGAELGPCGLRQ